MRNSLGKEVIRLPRKTVSIIMVSLLVISTLTLALNVQPVKAEPTTIIVPDDYPMIQQAVDNANDGDTVYVKTGIYCEHISISKSIVLEGEDSSTVFIVSNDGGDAISTQGLDVTVSNFTIKNALNGIAANDGTCQLINNRLLNNNCGVYWGCSGVIVGNIFQKNEVGVDLHVTKGTALLENNSFQENYDGLICTIRDGNVTLRDNVFTNDTCGFGLERLENIDFPPYLSSLNVDSSNTVNGDFIYCVDRAENVTLDGSAFPNASFLAITNSKNVTLENLVISGNNYQGLCLRQLTNFVIKNVTSSHNYAGIDISGCSNGTLENSTLLNNGSGCELGGDNIVFQNNTVYHNDCGLWLWGSSFCTLKSNRFENNCRTMGLGPLNSLLTCEIEQSNIVDGGMAYFLKNSGVLTANETTFPDAGFIEIANCTSATLKNMSAKPKLNIHVNSVNSLVVSNVSARSLYFYDVNNSLIIDSNFDGQMLVANYIAWPGICVRRGIFNGTFAGNCIRRYQRGVYVAGSCRFTENVFEYNTISAVMGGSLNVKYYKNTFRYNTNDIELASGVWDDGYPSGGNYWSKYNGTDLYSGINQDAAGSDGIGDSPHVIDEDNIDWYPLINPWQPSQGFNSTSGNQTYTGEAFSNATVRDFKFNETSQEIGFSLSGESGSVAYCRLVFSKALINGTLAVLVNGTSIPFTSSENETHCFLYFTYHLSYHEVLVLETVLGDINGDRKVDLKDIYAVAKAYGSSMLGPDPPGHPWNPLCDINRDGKIDLKDYYSTCKNYGKSW